MSPIDELRLRRARQSRDKLAAKHPEAFDPSQLPATPGELAAALGERRIGRPPSDDPAVVVTVRLPRSLLARLDTAVADGAVTRTEAIRSGIERWLRAERRRR